MFIEGFSYPTCLSMLLRTIETNYNRKIGDPYMGMRYTHTNINSPDWKRLAQFYIDVFDCKLVLPLRHLQGEWLSKASGIPGAEVHGAHIALPGYGEDGPTFEIFTHTTPKGYHSTAYNQQGFGHIGIHVDDVHAVYKKLLEHGGSSDGEIVSHYYSSVDKTLTIIYAKDPDGNIVEIQNWTDGNTTMNNQQEL
jgi:catechol 2,3-dioxygenase-like lactoylglutathione lyase family enzyme